MIERLMLTGMSGAGKSTVGRLVAETLGWDFVDMDDEIEARVGRTIPTIFAEDGEPAFRALEADLLAELLQVRDAVISTGGGAVCNDIARLAIRDSATTLSAWLTATPEVLLARVQAHADETRTTDRPMLAADDQLERMRSLIEQRAGYYGLADITIPVGKRSAERTAADLVELVNLANGRPSEVILRTDSAESSIRVGQVVADTVAEVVSDRWPKAQAVWVGVDARMAAANQEYLDALAESLAVPVHVYDIPAGETSKSLERYGEILDWMLTNGVRRSDVVIALGGGVVGDLMGFAAATVLRGIGLIQIPTTLLSMVDSSVGGKTGINHATGKNLIGAFYQPPVVLVDPRFLRTLPDREFRSGFGEVIKHGVIQASTPGGDPGFLAEVLRLNAAGLLSLSEPLTSWVIRQNISLKASVVAADEREAGIRQILNLGHTIGHGIEAAGYQLLHGEAIAVGLVAALTVAVARGDIDASMRTELMETLRAFGLPVSTNADTSVVLQKMGADKKVFSGKQNWVLPQADGGVFVTNEVSAEHIDVALEFVLGQPAHY
ncbi:MAG: 3-dehydroquinate synthase [Thermomicrobiales bacterium]|nr:3-dehydroquinate synthase [Thermomicrobiales bacterium]